MDQDISIDIQECDGIQVITLLGSLSDSHTATVRDAIHESLDDAPAELVIELSGVHSEKNFD